jgi:hypothetical protein
MSQKSTLAAGAVLLLAGAAAFTLIRKPAAEDGKGADAANAGKAASTRIEDNSAGSTGSKAARDRARDEVKHPELATKYGESRTNLSKMISGNVVSVLEDAVQMGELANSGQLAGPFGGRNALRMVLGRTLGELNLTEEQQEKASALYKDYQTRQLAKSKDAIERLRKDPTPLMRLMLASDSRAREEISDTEYRDLQKSAGEELAGVVNPLDRNNFRGGKPLEDEEFRRGLEGILDPTQVETLANADAPQDPAAPAVESPAGDPANIANMPSMELEKLDSTIVSVKKLTTGFKSVMEGFGGLQDLGPLIQQQQQQQGQGGQAPQQGATPPAGQ